MGKVVPINPPDTDVVALCRHLLEQAEAGNVRAVAVAIVRGDGAIVPTLAYEVGADAHGLLGGVMRLIRRIEDAIDDSDGD